MPNVTNPPALAPQQTGAWCFAAAEVMVRAYYNLPTMTQYDIARAALWALSRVDAGEQDQWDLAEALDQSLNQNENGGANMASQIVQLVRSHYGALNNTATNGHFFNGVLAAADVRGQIDADKIFVIGNPIHYYVVYGYENNGDTMTLLDSWPANVGGLRTQMTLTEFGALSNKLAIFF